MPRARESRYTLLNELKTLSKEADQFAEDFSYGAALDSWLASVKETILKIRDFKTEEEVRNVTYPPVICSVLKPRNRSNESLIAKFSENQKEHVHEAKQIATPACKNEAVKNKQTSEPNISEIPSSLTRNNLNSGALKSGCIDQNTKPHLLSSESKEIEKKSKNALCPEKRIEGLQLSRECTPKIPYPFKKNAVNALCDSQKLLLTPVGKTFNKLLNATIILDSSNKVNHDSNVANKANNCTVILDKWSSNSEVTPDKSSDDIHDNDMCPKTKSHSKRKSSECKTGSIKKRKVEAPVPAAASSSKAAKRKYPLTDKTAVTKTAGASDNRNKLSAVIVPSMQLKQVPTVSKEKKILEEIKKKEEKASENRKKVLAERQMKAEETQKKREEKQRKMVLKRLMMEKEKEEKRDMESKKSPVKATVKDVAKKPAMKTRVRELIEQNAVKENKSGVLTSSKQNEAVNGLKPKDSVDVTPPKTPISQKKFDSDNYELTPVPDSSTYNYSEDEDDKPSGKPIPLWAQGVHLKSALIQQFYYPTDTDELFGTYIESPDLAEIFKVQKKYYKLRTSSAIWHSPPARSLKS